MAQWDLIRQTNDILESSILGAPLREFMGLSTFQKHGFNLGDPVVPNYKEKFDFLYSPIV